MELNISLASPVLVIGAGSIGERHIGVLQELGYTNIFVFRQRNLPLRNIAAETVTVITDWSDISSIQPVAAIICTPTAQHVEQAIRCARAGLHVLVEKPLAHTLAGLDELRTALRESGTYLQVAYMLRYHPLLQHLHTAIRDQRWGRLLSQHSYWGEYLPDWHPWEDYRTSYAARPELGGGAALTLSHDLDLVNYLADSPVRHSHTLHHHRAELEVDVESGADISIAYANGSTAHCHLNFYERSPRRHYRWVFDRASVEFDYYRAELRSYPAGEEPQRWTASDFERNDMFRAQTKDFFVRLAATDRSQQALKAVDEAAVIVRLCQADHS